MPDTLPLRSPAAPPADAGTALVVDARRLAALLCASLRTVRTWDAAGKLPKPLRIGGRCLWSIVEIRAWLAAGAPSRAEWETRKAASRK
ncbi:MAG: hypothetical protein FD124_3889 [Alphaproteobacteria bacterium]|nr:MAG: hypothetical protein FD124_3889 [Alphaproteobacteria bacterium]